MAHTPEKNLAPILNTTVCKMYKLQQTKTIPEFQNIPNLNRLNYHRPKPFTSGVDFELKLAPQPEGVRASQQ